MVDSDVVEGGRAPADRSLDRARKLVALDRALLEIGEPGVLERAPADLASLEARLFGAPADAPAPPAARATGRRRGSAPPAAGGAPGAPALRLLPGSLEGQPAADAAAREALRAQLRLIPGGRRAV